MSYIERMEEEASELDTKINNLVSFLPSKEFKSLPDERKVMMFNQVMYMERYLSVLKERIEAETNRA